MVCKSWPSKLLKEIYPRTHFHTLICNAFHTFSLLAVTTICSNSYFMTPYPKSSAEFFSHKNLFTIPFKIFFQRYPYLLFILQNSFFWGSSRELVSTVEEKIQCLQNCLKKSQICGTKGRFKEWFFLVSYYKPSSSYLVLSERPLPEAGSGFSFGLHIYQQTW